jgi:hypothetical protein
MRSKLEKIHAAIVAVSPHAVGKLTTIYIKYTTPETGDAPYAVLWVKKSTELTLGLALPENYSAEGLSGSPRTIKYKGLTAFLTITPCSEMSADLGQWIVDAYRHLLSRNADSTPPAE